MCSSSWRLVTWTLLIQAYKHIFTSPSSVEREPKATRSGNARIHGMTCVTLPSIAYVATQVSNFHFPSSCQSHLDYNFLQVRFALSSSPVFSRTDLATDSERFYNSILDLFEDPDEQEEVNELMAWWNRYWAQFDYSRYWKLSLGRSFHQLIIHLSGRHAPTTSMLKSERGAPRWRLLILIPINLYIPIV